MGKNKVRVAVIGGGNMGSNHMRNYAKLPTVELVALADTNNETQRLAKQHKAHYYQDYKKMLSENEIDAVSIVVPTKLHYKIGAEVIKQGIHCLIEKPITGTVNEAERLIKLAKQHKIILTVGHIERFNPVVRKLKELIDKNQLGEVTSIVAKRVGLPRAEPKTDVILDLAVHDIDLISYLLGCAPQRVYSHGSHTRHRYRLDSTEILLDYGRASGFIQANWVTPVKVRNISITGSDGYAEGNYITQELKLSLHQLSRPAMGFNDFVSSFGEPKTRKVPVSFKEPLVLELAAFVNAIRTGHVADIVPPIAGLEALKIALAAVRQHNRAGVRI